MRKQLAILLLILPIAVTAKTAEEKGLAIIIEADKRDTGWSDSTSNLQMILRNAQGQESKRAIHHKELEVNDEGDKSLNIFNTPKDVKGTAFLSFTHATTADDQWLYLPALKRIKRISSSNKSGPFMGSEFAYEDISSQEIEKYSYKWIKDEVLDGKDVFVIERYPEYKYSGYKRSIVWIDKKIYMPLKTEFYDRKNALLKTLTFYDYNQYLDQYWRPDRLEMVNHLTKKDTTLLWSNYQFKTGLTDRNFDKNTLKRAR